MKIIPAIDIIEGKCVRLTKGDYSQKKIYNEDPLEVALAFEDAGLQHLHLVDLDGAKAGRIINWKVLEKLSSRTSLKIDFGGGLKSDSDLQIAFDCGAIQITGGSIAVKSKDLFLSWLEKFGADKIILGADANNERIAVAGWQEETDVYVYDFVREYFDRGIRYAISTDISKDGMLEGPSIDLYEKMLNEIPDLKLIASGGVAEISDLEKLSSLGLHGAIVGKAIYENRISLSDLAKFDH